MYGAYCMPVKAMMHITSRYMNYMSKFKAQEKWLAASGYLYIGHRLTVALTPSDIRHQHWHHGGM